MKYLKCSHYILSQYIIVYWIKNNLHVGYIPVLGERVLPNHLDAGLDDGQFLQGFRQILRHLLQTTSVAPHFQLIHNFGHTVKRIQFRRFVFQLPDHHFFGLRNYRCGVALLFARDVLLFFDVGGEVVVAGQQRLTFDQIRRFQWNAFLVQRLDDDLLMRRSFGRRRYEVAVRRRRFDNGREYRQRNEQQRHGLKRKINEWTTADTIKLNVFTNRPTRICLFINSFGASGWFLLFGPFEIMCQNIERNEWAISVT